MIKWTRVFNSNKLKFNLIYIYIYFQNVSNHFWWNNVANLSLCLINNLYFICCFVYHDSVLNLFFFIYWYYNVVFDMKLYVNMKIENIYLYFMNKHQINVRILSTQYETLKIRFFQSYWKKNEYKYFWHTLF